MYKEEREQIGTIKGESLYTWRYKLSSVHQNNCMLFVITSFVNDRSQPLQLTYNKAVLSVDLHSFTCPHCGNTHLHYHGTYKRSVITQEGAVVLNIQRMKCPVCGKTHAVLPDFIIPYSRVPLFVMIEIIHNRKTSFLNNIRYLLDRFRRDWQSLLKQYSIPLDMNIHVCCLKYNLGLFMVKRKLSISFS